MPTMPGKQCRVLGCKGRSKIGGNGYCDKHKNEGWSKYQRESGKRIYSTTRWKNVRKLVIRRANGMCELCLKKGIFKPGRDCDHIKPLAQGGDPFNLNNLQLLCSDCHSKKTANE